jgi:hypothetical protein
MTSPPSRTKPLLTGIGLALTPAVATLGFALCPHVRAGPFAADLATFAGATASALASLAVLSRAPASPVVRAVLVAASACALAAIAAALGAGLTPLRAAGTGLLGRVAFAHASGAVGAVVVAASLVALAHALGDLVGSHIEHPGHLLPACVVASAADLASVIHPSGPSHVVVSSERALALFAVSFPVLGTREHAPAIGIGDLLFLAVLFGAARRHGLPWVRVVVLMAAGIALAGALSAMLDKAVPALPALGVCMLAGVPAARRLQRKDRFVAGLFMLGASAIAAAVVLSRFVETRGPAP